MMLIHFFIFFTTGTNTLMLFFMGIRKSRSSLVSGRVLGKVVFVAGRRRRGGKGKE